MLALFHEDGRRDVAHTVPTGAFITFDSSTFDGEKLVSVTWDGKAVKMFAEDLRARAEQVEGTSSSAGPWILEQRHYTVLEHDLCELPGDDVSPVPDAVHFSGIVDSIAHVLDAPRLGGKQPFRAGHYPAWTDSLGPTTGQVPRFSSSPNRSPLAWRQPSGRGLDGCRHLPLDSRE
jgi:hypothetical protein